MHRRYTKDITLSYIILIICMYVILMFAESCTGRKRVTKLSSYEEMEQDIGNVLQQFLVDFVQTKSLELSSMSLVLTSMYVQTC